MVASPAVLKPVTERGWRAGLTNLLRKEAYKWLRTRYGLIHLGLWIFIINGITALILSTAGGLEAGETVVATRIVPFVSIITLFTTVGIVIVAMETILGEKKMGTAAWILSAPVSRLAFLLPKLVVIGISSVATMVVIPGLLAFLEFSYIPTAADSGDVAILPWIGAIGAISLSLLFFLALTLLLGTLFSSRGAVVGIPIFVLFIGEALVPVLPDVVYMLTPWALIDPLAIDLADETRTVGSKVQVYATLAWVAIFTAASFWRFRREEF